MTPTWEFSLFVDMANRTNEEQEYTVKAHFADGFSVEDIYAGDAFNKIPVLIVCLEVGSLSCLRRMGE